MFKATEIADAKNETEEVLETVVRSVVSEVLLAGADSNSSEADVAKLITTAMTILEKTMYPLYRPMLRSAYNKVLAEMGKVQAESLEAPAAEETRE